LHQEDVVACVIYDELIYDELNTLYHGFCPKRKTKCNVKDCDAAVEKTTCLEAAHKL
jgi:hypothetical protein